MVAGVCVCLCVCIVQQAEMRVHANGPRRGFGGLSRGPRNGAAAGVVRAAATASSSDQGHDGRESVLTQECGARPGGAGEATAAALPDNPTTQYLKNIIIKYMATEEQARVVSTSAVCCPALYLATNTSCWPLNCAHRKSRNIWRPQLQRCCSSVSRT